MQSGSAPHAVEKALKHAPVAAVEALTHTSHASPVVVGRPAQYSVAHCARQAPAAPQSHPMTAACAVCSPRA